MPSIAKVVAILIIVGGLLIAANHFMTSQRQESTAKAAALTSPPAGASYVDVDAAGVMFTVAGAKKAERDQVAASFQGLWVPDEGWESEVVDVTGEDGGRAVRMSQVAPGLIGGSFYIVALCPVIDQDVKKGDRATVQGVIKSVDVLTGGPAPTYRILLHQARVLKVDHR